MSEDVSPGKPKSGFRTQHFSITQKDIDYFQRTDGESRELAPGEVRYRDIGISWYCRYFKAGAAVLQGPSYSEQNPPSLGSDGSDLAWNLSYLMTAEPDRFARIAVALREVVPIVKRIRARPVPIVKREERILAIDDQKQPFVQRSTVMGQELIFDMASGDGLPASAVSEGTLVVLAILTLLYGDETADLIMLDDVELGLHPQAQRDLMRRLRKVQENNPKLQIIVSTHSPYIIDELEPEDVWLFTTDFEGCALSKRLSEHPDAKRAMEVLSTGEFWSAEGENWVRDAEPVTRVAEEPAK